MPKNTTAEVATKADMRVTSEAPPAYAQWITAMVTEAETMRDDDFDPREILARALEASTFEAASEALQSQSLPGASNLVGVLHDVLSFEVRVSEKTDGLPVYLAVEAKHIDGEQFAYSVGASNVVALLWQARQFDRLPLRGTIAERELASGNTLLSFVPYKSK